MSTVKKLLFLIFIAPMVLVAKVIFEAYKISYRRDMIKRLSKECNKEGYQR